MPRSLLYLLIACSFTMAATSTHAAPYTIANSRLAKINIYNNTLEMIGADSYGSVISLESSAEGLLYGVDAQFDTLIRIDPQTATRETIGPLGIDIGYGSVDLAMDDGGQLWLLVDGGLFRVDRATGAASFECQGASPDLHGLTFLDERMLTSSSMYLPPDPGCGLGYADVSSQAITTGPDGQLYWKHLTTVPWDPLTVIKRYDPTTGDGQDLLVTQTSLEGLAVLPGQLTMPIPVLSRAGTTILVLLIATAAVFLLRSKS